MKPATFSQDSDDLAEGRRSEKGDVAPLMAEFPGLDYDFLRYMDVRGENQRKIQSFYLPLYRGCQSVLDLGCGDGDFIALLAAEGIDAIGVDADDKASASAHERGLPIVRDDVFHYLRRAAAASVDGVFCAHLVEHLPYPQTIELLRLCYRVLKPGGVITLATPDPRSLFSHLEMFYLHYGHVTFYHPRLLCFFLEHEGFVTAEFGVNPETASPLLPQVQDLLRQGSRVGEKQEGASSSAGVTYLREVPPQGRSWLHRGSYQLKRALVRWMVQPHLDDLTRNINQELDRLHHELSHLRAEVRVVASSLHSLNGPFECYATAYKPASPLQETGLTGTEPVGTAP